VNNCVGEQTQKYFLLFLLYVGVLGYGLLVLVAARFSVCIVEGTAACGAHGNVADYVLGALLIMLSLLFAIFVTIMGVDQLQSLLNEESYLERLQQQQRERRALASGEDVGADATGPATASAAAPRSSWLVRLERAFGTPRPSRWYWLLPTTPELRPPPD
jgi:hypothetical protein